MRVWLPCPVGSHWRDGSRWKLYVGGREVGRVVRLLPGGLWEARLGGYYSPGHSTLAVAARVLFFEYLRSSERKLMQGFADFVLARVNELGKPDSIAGCCPLGLYLRFGPRDGGPRWFVPAERPTPKIASTFTGLPLGFCHGVASGWDGVCSLGSDRLHMKGYRLGFRLRRARQGL